MTSQSAAPLSWMKPVLRCAGAYNLLWGAWVVLWPQWSFALSGFAEPLNVPGIWQCLGMVIGVYGIAYWIAAGDPYRYWPIVLVGLLGKIFGPIGLAWSVWQGDLPPSAARLIVVNDLIWWGPFAAILWYAIRHEQSRTAIESEDLEFDEAIARFRSQRGETLKELSQERPLLVLFLRHAGCTFCREALADLSKQRSRIEQAGLGIALVHMEDESRANEFFVPYGMDDVPRFSDPQQQLYRAFDLPLGTFRQLFGLRIWWRGFLSALVHRHGFGAIRGNGFRMPGVFILHRGEIIKAHRHASADERPDYAEFSCPLDRTAA